MSKAKETKTFSAVRLSGQIGKTLALLRKKRKRGITPLDFPTGFRLSCYIMRLRNMGYDIRTLESGIGQLARYVLIGG